MEGLPEPAGGRRRVRDLIAFAVGLLLFLGLAALLPDLLPPAASGLQSDQVRAVITAIEPGTQDAPPTATIRILDGPYADQGGPATLEGPSGQLELPDYKVGDEVLAAIDTNPDGTQTLAVVDRWRLPLFEWLVVGLAVAAVAVAGWRGLRALVSLGITLLLVLRVLIPLLLRGVPAVPLAIVLGIAITVLSFLLTQGFSRATVAAILGTAGGLAVTGVLAAIVTGVARLTPSQGSQEILALEQIAPGTAIDVSGLLLAAVIFGGLGVLNDVAISQAVTVEELRELDPGLSRRAVYSRTMRVGTAHLAANINTLVFAYLGAALPLVVLLAVQVPDLTVAANQEFMAVEIIRAVVGALGVLAAVPLTTAIATFLTGPTLSARAGLLKVPDVP
jgi:uncharacterized membrane protein